MSDVPLICDRCAIAIDQTSIRGDDISRNRLRSQPPTQLAENAHVALEIPDCDEYHGDFCYRVLWYAVDVGMLFGGNDAQRMFFGLRCFLLFVETLLPNTVFTAHENTANTVLFNSNPFRENNSFLQMVTMLY
jgi:hypothetical protein